MYYYHSNVKAYISSVISQMILYMILFFIATENLFEYYIHFIVGFGIFFIFFFFDAIYFFAMCISLKKYNIITKLRKEKFELVLDKVLQKVKQNDDKNSILHITYEELNPDCNTYSDIDIMLYFILKLGILIVVGIVWLIFYFVIYTDTTFVDISDVIINMPQFVFLDNPLQYVIITCIFLFYCITTCIIGINIRSKFIPYCDDLSEYIAFLFLCDKVNTNVLKLVCGDIQTFLQKYQIYDVESENYDIYSKSMLIQNYLKCLGTFNSCIFPFSLIIVIIHFLTTFHVYSITIHSIILLFFLIILIIISLKMIFQGDDA